MTLWTAEQAAAATGGTQVGRWKATGVSIDTRTLEPGDLFVALTAARDGHDFVEQALDKGAAAALVSRVPAGVPATAPLLLVQDVLAGLEALGRAARDRCKGRFVAVTGSAGKTSTKEMLSVMLSPQGRTHASVASYNNHWGVPLTLARMPADTEYAVIEIGMNHPGEIAPLARMARPHVAMITTVAPAHLEAFENVEAIAAEKASVFEGLEAGGVAVVNGDLDTTSLLLDAAAGYDRVIFGTGADSDYRADSITVTPDAAVVQAIMGTRALMFKVRAPGRHFAMNALGALAAVDALGADPAQAAVDLADWSVVRGRGARETVTLDASGKTALELIDDSYNANPASVVAALAVLTESDVNHVTGRAKGHRRVAILGDMKELGDQERDLHADLTTCPEMDGVDQVHCVGHLMRHLYNALPKAKQGVWAETGADLSPLLEGRLQAGDVVLVKGSLSMGMAGIVDAIRKMGHPAPQDDE
ncbi:MAG: UDP-N-acetylmuramoyl-tripeptide--D-alanyl-D-alanine ligase [Paracoccaceae bacterium]